MKSPRVLRKARRAAKTELDREFDARLGAIKREREEALAAAGETFRKGLAQLKTDHQAARKQAWDEYDQARNDLLRELVASAAAEAVAA